MAIAASCGSLNALTLGLPTRAAVPDAKGALPKQMFIGRGAVSAKTKQRFATDIESIGMLAILRPATTGLAESRRFPEILVLGLHVPSGAAVPVEVIDHIAAQRQGGIVFVCVRGRRNRGADRVRRRTVRVRGPAERAGQTGAYADHQGACRSMASGRRVATDGVRDHDGGAVGLAVRADHRR